jgi:hypothetical protein
MTSIQRYDAWPQEWPFEDEHGDLVTYEDHRKIVEELEGKLAKAVNLALEECPFRDGTRAYNDWWYDLRTTLAELKGQDDE